eukprot:1573835-Alexandrium_andersonii.AAC.1
MAERPSFLRPGPEKRRRHLRALFFTAGASGSDMAGTASGGASGVSRNHLPFCLPPPLFFGE